MTVEDGLRAPSVAPALPRAPLLAHLREELRWLSLRLRVVVERGRRRRAVGPPSEYRGLYISDEEVDHLLQDDLDAAPGLRIDEVVHEAAALRRDLDARNAALGAHAAELPLERLTRAFALSPEERLVLVVALAPSFDLGYEKIYAYANDDITKKRPTVGLALDLLADDRERALELRSLFYADAPLCRHQLVTLAEDAGAASSSLLSRFLDMDHHVAEVLLGFEGLDPRLTSFARIADAAAEGDERAAHLARVMQNRRDARIYVAGRWHDEKLAVAVRAAGIAGLRAVVLDGTALAANANPESLLRLALRDAVLQHAALVLTDWDAQREGDGDPMALRTAARALIEDHPLPLIVNGVRSNPEPPHPRFDLQFDYPAPDFASRKQSWDEAHDSTSSTADTGLLAATFRFGRREIRGAARMATSLKEWRGAGEVAQEDLRLAARLQSQPRLTALARKIAPTFTWDDIVLPVDRLAQLREIAVQVLYRHIVFDEWGFAAKGSLGRGVAALFAGQSGTGKTMAAEIIAHDLGLDLYKIDLSGLVSKYIGETEKNLARVFDEAGDSNAILFFDEADAVFGKRTEVRDSHDRYANIEVSYLLQKMEEYDGIVVLASNLRSNLDDAFLRRMRAIVEFPFPEEDDRLRIWRRTFTSAAPVADDVDLPFMARQFRIAGGNIKNIVLLAAFLAASQGEPVRMQHVIRATKREYQKLGRLITESDFGPWYTDAMA